MAEKRPTKEENEDMAKRAVVRALEFCRTKEEIDDLLTEICKEGINAYLVRVNDYSKTLEMWMLTYLSLTVLLTENDKSTNPQGRAVFYDALAKHIGRILRDYAKRSRA